MELTQETLKRIHFLFGEGDEAAACQLLLGKYGNSSFFEKDSPEGLERVLFAILKLSNGKLDKLYKAMDLANSDWRDVLIAAGFANDIYAHQKWLPRRRHRIWRKVSDNLIR